MRPRRPINADVPPPPEEAGAEPEPIVEEEAREDPAAAAAEKPPRPPKPLAPKLLAALVVLALVFIVAAILGSSGGSDQGATGAPAPTPPPAGEAGGGDSAPPQTAEALGYPAFATDNTTRVGGADATADAAAVALAVFPATTPSQRPAAVTLVGEEDWAGAIAAAVLMAPPVRAPLLFSAPDEQPEATAEALAALEPRGSSKTGGGAVFAVGPVTLPEGDPRATRIDSGDPASTAAQIATLRDRLFGGAPEAIVVASSDQPGFAMPAAAWAARSGDPVLYADSGKLPQPTAAALERHPRVPVYVLGPAAAISAAALGEIEAISKRVRRVGGADPVAGAIAFARFSDGGFGWNVNDPGHGFVLARGDEPLQAAAAAPLSAAGTWGPLLLTDDPGRLPPNVRDYFLDVKPGYTDNPTRAFYNHVWVVGDQAAIDVNQQAEVNELAELAKIGGGE